MKSYPPFDRPLCEVLAGGVWWPATLDTWEQRADGWWAFVWVTVTEMLTVPRVGVVEAPSRYVQWFSADRLTSRANDERRPTHSVEE